MNGNHQFLGIVQNGEPQLLVPYSPLGGSVRLTRIPMQAAQPPESAELDLTDYEGQAIMVSGHNGGGQVFGQSSEAG